MGGLERYLERRDFSNTPEPSLGDHSPALALRYSIQKHAATRTHFDLRLEHEGVLLSWAVTRGPSLQPSDKRLAVRTEDHPISYLDFEGTIPPGNYGAGTVMLWDIGHWEPLAPISAGLRKGHLKFRLHGVRLSGAWHLLRMKTRDKRENWLLTKDEDEAAGRRDPVARYRRSVSSRRTLAGISREVEPPSSHGGTRPSFRKPQLATLCDEFPQGSAWWHELKFDGYRGLVMLGKGGTKIYTRSGNDWTGRFESLLAAFDDVNCDSALIDGEIVAGAGLQGFSSLQKALKFGGPYRFFAFDLLELDGRSLTEQTLADRRSALEGVWRNLPPLGLAQLSPIIEREPARIFRDICSAGGEGLISKLKHAPYRGTRTQAWLKMKCERRDEFVVIGWQESNKRGRPFSSLLLGTAEEGGLRYVGKVGTGFDNDEMEALMVAMRPLARKTPAAEVNGSETKGAQWITPRLVAEVQYAERTPNGLLRHSRYIGLREDKPAREVLLDNDHPSVAGEVNVVGVRVSSAGRMVYPEAQVTKGEVAEYYAAISERILPFAANRPLSLLRMPEGLKGERFFQKHTGKGFPKQIKSMLVEEAPGRDTRYMYVSNTAGLVAAVQMGTLEFHIWGSRRDRLERPDRMVFDLDPDEALDFSAVTSAALDIRGRLEDLGLPSWPLLSGGKGVHVIVPLRRVAAWDTAKLYSRVFATMLAEREPKRFVASMSKSRRAGKIFIDWLRNERGATAITPFSLRARPEAPVAVPVRWDDLASYRQAQSFDARRVLRGDIPDVRYPDAVSLTKDRIAALERALLATKPAGATS
ncbi:MULTISPECIES: DNA ligase D [unclassified Salipiger]|uniref:DNA ligase D n=1 Tax=unclassified Salipiger TaxID=2640570 RepID=UPI0013B5F440|nr:MULTISPECIES: DNA ligase D [unclassified Salipiger]NDV52545.1 DNA ligase D [Salipiger sp. PrR003]NDW32714.1 DNA ligase D [Salipiger sp. PrR007]